MGVKHCQEDIRFKHSTAKSVSFSCSISIVVSDESLVPFDTYSTKWTAAVLSIPTKTNQNMYLTSAVRCCVLVFWCFGVLEALPLRQQTWIIACAIVTSSCRPSWFCRVDLEVDRAEGRNRERVLLFR